MTFLLIVLLLTTTTKNFCAYPLHEAARNGNTKTVQALIVAGAGVNIRDNYGQTPLYVAAGNGETEIVQAFLEAGAKVNTRDDGGETPLFVAVSRSKTEIVKALLVAGADVNIPDNYGQTPLYVAAWFGFNTETVKTLLAASADVNIRNNEGQTPLYRAAYGGNTETVQALIAAGAGVNTHDNYGQTPLYAAAWNGNTEEVRALLAAGALLDEESLKILPSHLLALACAYNHKNLCFLQELALKEQFDLEYLEQIHEQYTEIKAEKLAYLLKGSKSTTSCVMPPNGTVAALCKKHGARSPIGFIQQKKRGHRLPHRSVFDQRAKQMSTEQRLQVCPGPFTCETELK